jgi:hypothetical protein
MGRALKFDTEIRIGQGETVVTIRQAHVEAWALEVGLLLHELNDSLVVRSSANATVTLSLLPEERKRKAIRTVVTRSKPNALKFQVSRTQAETLQALLLRAYRDGVAEVNHIHIEGLLDGVEYDLTPFFEKSRPPMSAGDAAKTLG